MQRDVLRSLFDAGSLATMAGFAPLWAWQSKCLFSADLIAASQSIGSFGGFAPLIAAVVLGVSFIMVTLLRVDVGLVLLGKLLVPVLMVTLGIVGGVSVAMYGESSPVLFVVGLVLVALSCVALTLLWIAVMTLDVRKRGAIWISGGLALAFPLIALLDVLEAEVARLVLIACPLTSLALSFAASRMLGKAEALAAASQAGPGETGVPFPASVPPALLVLLFCYAACYSAIIQIRGETPSWTMQTELPKFAASALPCAIVFVSGIFTWKPHALFNTMVGVLIACLLALPFLLVDFAYTTDLVINYGYGCLSCMAWVALFGLLQSGGRGTSRPVSMIQAAYWGGYVLGSGALLCLRELSLLDETHAVALESSLACTMVAVAVLVLAEGKNGTWALVEQAAPQTANDPLDEACALLSEDYALTAREAEVLVLLAHGRSAPYIAKRLCVAESTVKSHVKHIYTKTGADGRQDLIDLCVSRAGRNPSKQSST